MIVCPEETKGELEEELGGALLHAMYSFISRDAKVTHLAWAWQDLIEGVELHVTDEGPGLSVQERERAFDRFWQGESGDRRRYPGAGRRAYPPPPRGLGLGHRPPPPR